MASKMQTNKRMAKRPVPMMKAGPNMMPHTGKKDCRCPNCKDRRK